MHFPRSVSREQASDNAHNQDWLQRHLPHIQISDSGYSSHCPGSRSDSPRYSIPHQPVGHTETNNTKPIKTGVSAKPNLELKTDKGGTKSKCPYYK